MRDIWPSYKHLYCNWGKELKVGLVSGFFAPIHGGHVQCFQAAKMLCDKLIVIVNSDYQTKLKGSTPFMDEDHRLFIVESIKYVDKAIICRNDQKDVTRSIAYLRRLFPENPMSFFNSGDRRGQNLESAEMKLCKELGIDYQVIDLPKIFSSSKLISDACAHSNKT